MKRCIILFLALATLMGWSEDSVVYVTAGDFLDRYRISEEGEVKREMHHKLENGPGGIAFSPDGNYLYVSKRKPATADVYHFDRKAGSVGELMSSTPIEKWSEGIYYSPTQKSVFVPCYTSSRLVRIGVNSDGTLGKKALQNIATGNGPHDIIFDRSSRYAYIPFLKDNTIGIYTRDLKTGELSPHADTPVYDGQVEGFDPKTGPRHLLFHPKLNILYAHNQMNATIYAYDHDTATSLLSPRQGVRIQPKRIEAKESTGGGGLEISKDGKNIYICSRSHHYLTHVRVDENGKMQVMDDLDTVEGPRVVKLSRDGRWLFVAGQTSGKLGILKVDPESGKLSKHREIDCGGSVPWLFLP